MSKMIERVAIEILASQLGEDVRSTWVAVGPRFQEPYRRMARAAIAAMREPTEHMFCTGDEAIIDCLNNHPTRAEPTPAQVSWQAMIDAALAEQP